jgi:hypothetical protein
MKKECKIIQEKILDNYPDIDLENEILSHLESCTECNSYLKEIIDVLAALKSTGQIHIPDEIKHILDDRILERRKRSRIRIRLAYAIVLPILIITLLIFFFYDNFIIRDIVSDKELWIDAVYYKGEPATIILSENKNFINILVLENGE